MIGDANRVLFDLFGDAFQAVSVEPIGGGCISEAFRVVTRSESGVARTMLWKRNRLDFLDNFEAEAQGLKELAFTKSILTPCVIGTGASNDQSHLWMHWVETSPTDTRFYVRFGRALASHHRATSGKQVGLGRNNYLGASHQLNVCPNDTSWTNFVATHRLEPQVRWASDAGLLIEEALSDMERVISLLPSLLDGRSDVTVVLHGDLWSGNYLCDAAGEPAWIDPAVYHGCREAEFGMIELFGSCPPAFYEAYQDTWPLKEGWRRRVDVYMLYHLLNHLNLFGSGYLGQCCDVAGKLLRATE